MEPTEENRRAWDEVHRARAEAAAERTRLPDAVRARLPKLDGRKVLHLGCGEGEESVELAALGALVTGVDASGEALALARERTESVLFIQADAEELPTELRRGRFDLVYAGRGSLSRLGDLPAWTGGIASALRPGGRLLVHDEHPSAACLDALLRWRGEYFDEDAVRLGDVVTAVAAAGLEVRALEELPLPGSGRHGRRVPASFVLVAERPAPAPER